MTRLWPILFTAFLLTAPAPGRTADWVDIAIVLAVDTSSSVSTYEFNLQMRGLAKAFRDPAVHDAIATSAPNGIAITLVQWASPDAQVPAFDWTQVHGPTTAELIAGMIDRTPRLVNEGGTAISHAIDFSIAMLGRVSAARKVIDVSGDGRNNMGGYVITATPRAVAAGITVNGLAILNEDATLAEYYRLAVIGGIGAFVIVADDYRDFADAIRLKLIQEIKATPIASLPAPRYAASPPLAGRNRISPAAPALLYNTMVAIR
jgi:hypothetical protein